VRNDPRLFAGRLLRIKDDKKRIVPFRLNPAQVDYLRHRTRRDIILKARQLGFSTLIQAELYRIATTRPATTMTITDEHKNTAKMRAIADTFHNNMPEEFRAARGRDGATITTYPEMGSEAMSATAGNVKTGRAGTYTQFHGSEVAFWPDAESVIGGALQGGNPDAVLESTPNGAQGYFYNLCMDALDGDDTWRLHFYPWWWKPEYATPLDQGEEITLSDDEGLLVEWHGLTNEQIKWRRHKQKEVGAMFAQEYPEDARSCFLLSGQGYFGPLDGVFSAPQGATPQEGHRYFAGIDWGQMNDWTVLSIVDQTTMQQVAIYRWRGLPWREMRRQIAIQIKRWRIALIAVEYNSIGSVNFEELQREIANEITDTNIGNLFAFNMSANSKQGVLSGLHIALNEDGWRFLPDQDQMREFRAFQSKQTARNNWTYSAPSGQHDDTVIAGALAINAALRGSISVPGMVG
jgi:hypothetical protein